MNPDTAWQCEVRADGSGKTVVLSGEIDMTGAEQLLDLLREAVRGADAVVVDIAAVAFIDSTVISSLITARAAATAAGCRLTVINPSPQVRRVLDVAGVLDTLAADG